MLGDVLHTLGAQWKAILALTGALSVGVAGGAYYTLPRAVGDMQSEQMKQGRTLERLEQAVLANTRAIRLISCVQAANMLDDAHATRSTVQQCISTYGIGVDDNGNY